MVFIPSSSSVCSSLRVLWLLSVVSVPAVVQGEGAQEPEFSSALFAPCPEVEVPSAPSMFPKPTDLYRDPTIAVIATPRHGKHRKDKNAVFAYAEGYDLKLYRAFVETLESTGYDGDVVLSIADTHNAKENVETYLQQFTIDTEQGSDNETPRNKSKVNVVVYMNVLSCFEKDYYTRTTRTFNKWGDPDAFQMCALDDVYGWKKTNAQNEVSTTPAKDMRVGRVVATLRYEWYWIWSLQYNPHSWIMLIDARDTVFQTDPFQNLISSAPPPSSSTGTDKSQEKEQDNGWLYLFGENHEATRLGKSKHNSNWLRNGYGNDVQEKLKEKPTICSGSTMGEQIALETYLRAMINESDETEIRMMGSDQGFHNYLYYSSKLRNAKTIKGIIVWEQGKGIINNLGALRIKPLKEWGIFGRTHQNEHVVYQWDLKTPSPVIHQFDRDKDVSKFYSSKSRTSLNTLPDDNPKSRWQSIIK